MAAPNAVKQVSRTLIAQQYNVSMRLRDNDRGYVLYVQRLFLPVTGYLLSNATTECLSDLPVNSFPRFLILLNVNNNIHWSSSIHVFFYCIPHKQ